MKTMFIFLLLCCNHSFAQTDTTDREILHRYENGTTSVSKEQTDNRRAIYRLYDPEGTLTYSLEEYRGSYSVTVELSVSESGQVTSAKQTIHPGGSRYWSVYTIYFTNDNQPEKMVKEKFPIEDLSNESQNIMYWNPERNQWDTKRL